MQKQSRHRGQKSSRTQTFAVNLGGHNIAMSRDQVLANGQGWKKCHGEHEGVQVNSLSIKRIGDKIFVKDGSRLAGYNVHELAVAMPGITGLIKDGTPTAKDS